MISGMSLYIYMCTHTYICMHACQAASVMSDSLQPLSTELFRQGCWSGLLWPSPGNLLDPGIEPGSPAAPALQADPLLLSHQGSPYLNMHINNAHTYIHYMHIKYIVYFKTCYVCYKFKEWSICAHYSIKQITNSSVSFSLTLTTKI